MSRLWDPARYAVQLRVPAPTSDEALRRAVAYHAAAARAAGLPGATLVRAEVLTVLELERSWDDDDGNDLDTDVVASRRRVCAEVYSATRGLMAAATPAEVTAVVHRFVASVGGTTEPGVPRYLPGTCDIDLRIDGGEAQHATTEALSVAGLMFESVLPTLLSDARRALARLRQDQPRPEPTQGAASLPTVQGPYHAAGARLHGGAGAGASSWSCESKKEDVGTDGRRPAEGLTNH